MEIRQAVFPLVALSFLFFVAGCDNNRASAEKKEPTVYSRDSKLPTGASWLDSGIGVALADMDGDGDLDLVSVAPDGVKYFENQGSGNFVDRGVIAKTGAEWLDSGIGVAIGDIDGDGVLDIVIAAPDGIQIIKNPVPQKK
ncbi:MAG: VCBS repeat-containing protein [bacterium]|nr:VCBS repeat-containing protein [bacterium]